MSTFTTRVELYGEPTFQTYKTLHDKMEAGGFTRKISFEGNKTIYWLPNAEYSIQGTYTNAQIRDKAVAITKTVWVDFGVLSTKTEEARAVHNLKEVQG
jgi:hypothetical protein